MTLVVKRLGGQKNDAMEKFLTKNEAEVAAALKQAEAVTEECAAMANFIDTDEEIDPNVLVDKMVNLYQNTQHLKIAFGNLEMLLADESDEVYDAATFMQDLVDILNVSNEFLESVDMDLCDACGLCENLNDEGSDDMDDEVDDGAQDDESDNEDDEDFDVVVEVAAHDDALMKAILAAAQEVIDSWEFED